MLFLASGVPVIALTTKRLFGSPRKNGKILARGIFLIP